MNFEFKSLSLAAVGNQKADALMVFVAEDFVPGKGALSETIASLQKQGDFSGKAGKCLYLHRPAGIAAPRVVLVGVGDASAKAVRTGVLAALPLLKGTPGPQLLLGFACAVQAANLRSAVLAVADGTYAYTHTKSDAPAAVLQKCVIACAQASRLEATFAEAVAVAAGVELAKEWANRPANHATPNHLAQAARALARAPKMRCEVLGPKDVERLAMGAFMAVAQGSEQPLRLIVLKYEGAPKAQAPHVIVGKGITFDSGGISIKPAAEMDEMKFDMSGAASVLGVFKALSLLRPAINVVGLIPACENLINGKALKPGDVIKSMSGQTIEVLNTDAEGRLILCDALSYAERFKPQSVIDIATLTGACVVALGAVRSGLFSTHDGLARTLEQAAEVAQDLCWRMPLDEDYAEGLKSNFADVANIGGRMGGAITAAKFLQRFATKFPWAHLDIAGTAWKSGAAKGATGRPVGLLVEYLLRQSVAK